MTKTRAYKKWLKKNFIFFQVFSLSFLGIASIIVAINNTIISSSQLDLLKLEHMPIVNIQRSFSNSREIIEVGNIGYHMFEPKIECTSVFFIEEYRSGTANCEMNYYFELVDFFEDKLKVENTIGDIFTLNSGYNANLEIYNLIEDFKKSYGSNIKSADLLHFIRISYKDEVKEDYSKYYKVTPNSLIEISQRPYDSFRKQLKTQSILQGQFSKHSKPAKIVVDIQNIYDEFLKANGGLTECDI